jgi:hypothetical protein
MLKKILFLIILLIIFHDIYFLYNYKHEKIEKVEMIKKKSIKINEPIYNKNYSVIEKPVDKILLSTPIEEVSHVELSENEIDDYVDPNIFGKPSDYVAGKYIYWDFNNPKPWEKIMYKYGDEFPFYFFIKIRIPSLNDYENWKDLINNLDFDAQKGEMIIPSKDEETALSIANLIISNFKGSVTINDIVKKDLLQISIEKCKKYPEVKKKMISQIIESTTTKIIPKFTPPKEKFTNIKHNQVIQKEEPVFTNTEEFVAYEGGEFSFL